MSRRIGRDRFVRQHKPASALPLALMAMAMRRAPAAARGAAPLRVAPVSAPRRHISVAHQRLPQRASVRRAYATAAPTTTHKEASHKSLLEMSFNEIKHDLKAGRKFVGIDEEDEDYFAEPEVAAAMRLSFAKEVQSADVGVALQQRLKHNAPPKGAVLSPAYLSALLDICDRSPASLGLFLNTYRAVESDLARIQRERNAMVSTPEGNIPAALYYHPLTVLVQFQLQKLKEENERYAATAEELDRQADEQLKKVDDLEAKLKDLTVDDVLAKHPEWLARSQAAAFDHRWWHHTLPRADDSLPMDPDENFEPDDGWAATDDAHDDHGHGHGGGHH